MCLFLQTNLYSANGCQYYTSVSLEMIPRTAHAQTASMETQMKDRGDNTHFRRWVMSISSSAISKGAKVTVRLVRENKKQDF